MGERKHALVNGMGVVVDVILIRDDVTVHAVADGVTAGPGFTYDAATDSYLPPPPHDPPEEFGDGEYD